MGEQVGHSLRRTSPKGERFLGTCVNCGATDLPSSAVLQTCPNPKGLTQDELLLDAIEASHD